MKMRMTFCSLIVLFFLSTLNLIPSFAQDSPQWDLPDGVSARLGKGRIQEIAYSPDGSRLAVGSIIGIWVYDADTGAEVALIGGHTSYVNSIAFSPDGNTIATGSNHGLQLWDVTTGSLRNTIEHAGWVNSVAFSPDGNTIATGGYHNTVRLWDANTGTLRNTLTGHTDFVYSVAFSPDGNMIATGSGDNTVRLWDTNTATLRNTLTGHRSPVFSVAFSPDGNTIASGSLDNTVRLWDTNTATLRNTLEHTGEVTSVAFSPDGNTIATGSSDDTVRLWDANTGTLRNTLTGHTSGVTSVAFSPDGNTLASGGGDGTVRLWDANTATLQNILTGHTGWVESVAYSPDGNTLASGNSDRTVRLWDANTGTLRNTLTGHTSVVHSVAFSPDGPILASGSEDGTILLWRLTPTSTMITFNPDSVPDQTFAVGAPVSLTLPSATGGTPPYTYTLSPIPPIGLHFDTATQLLSGTPTTATPPTLTTYTATDATGASASLNFTIEVIEEGTGPGGDPLDVDGDGQITVIDLAIVALFYGTQVPVGVNLLADVNADGLVDLADLAAVAQGIDAAGGGLNQLALWEVEAALFAAVEQAAEFEGGAGAPGRAGTSGSTASVSVRLSTKNVSDALTAVRTDVRKPQKGFDMLEKFLALLTEMTTTPETTALLANYPNPFNPETWIPYHLAKDAEVKLTIYDMRGTSVRELVLGHQAAGVYRSKSRAAYWDGRNNSGEPVASGVYFYTLTAGDFNATRKMLIRK